MITDKEFLVLYYGRHSEIRQLVLPIARGIGHMRGARVWLRSVPKVTTVCESAVNLLLAQAGLNPST